MFESGAFLAFVAAALIVELTPGPNMGVLAVLSLQQGVRAGMRLVAGITLGLGFYMLATVAGLAEVLARWPWAYQSLRWAGVILMVALAVETWRGGQADSGRIANARPTNLVWRGFLINILNPKAALLYVALLPGFTDSRNGDIRIQAFVLGSVHVALSVAVHTAIVLGAGRAHAGWRGRRWPVSATQARKLFAGLLVAIAAWVAWETRSAS